MIAHIDIKASYSLFQYHTLKKGVSGSFAQCISPIIFLKMTFKQHFVAGKSEVKLFFGA